MIYDLVLTPDYYIPKIPIGTGDPNNPLSFLDPNDSPERQEAQNLIARKLTSFLSDFVRVGYYLLLNYLYYTPGFFKKRTFFKKCHPSISYIFTYKIKNLEYSVLLQNKDCSLSKVEIISDFQSIKRVPNIKQVLDKLDLPISHQPLKNHQYCALIQDFPYLPHPEILNACHMRIEREGLKMWHDGRKHYRWAVRYQVTNEFPPPEITEEMNKDIIKHKLPILYNRKYFKKQKPFYTKIIEEIKYRIKVHKYKKTLKELDKTLQGANS